MEIVFRAFRAFRDMWIHLIYVTRLSKFSNRLGVSAIQQRFPKAMFFCANIAVAQHVSYCIGKCVTCCRIQAGQPMAHLNEHFRGLIGSSSHIETMRPHEGVTIKLLEMSILLQESALVLWCHLSWALQSYLQYCQLFVFLPDLPTCPTPAPPFTRTIHDYPIGGPFVGPSVSTQQHFLWDPNPELMLGLALLDMFPGGKLIQPCLLTTSSGLPSNGHYVPLCPHSGLITTTIPSCSNNPNYFSRIFPHFVGFPNSWGYHTQK